jgi:hypothetical protein
MRNAYRILLTKLEGKTPLGTHGHFEEDNIKIDIRETELDNVDWIHLAQDVDRWQALLNTVMKVLVS